MISKPNIYHIITKSYEIRFYLKNTDVLKVGIGKDVLFVSPVALNNKLVSTLNDRLVFKHKIGKPCNKLLAIGVKGKINTRLLYMIVKKHFPTVFDSKVIKRMNEADKIISMHDHIKQSIISILGKSHGEKIIENKFQAEKKCISIESIESSDSDIILSDFNVM